MDAQSQPGGTLLRLRCLLLACVQALKDGKRLLKDGSAAAAMVRFEKALMLAKVRRNIGVHGLPAGWGHGDAVSVHFESEWPGLSVQCAHAAGAVCACRWHRPL